MTWDALFDRATAHGVDLDAIRDALAERRGSREGDEGHEGR